MTGSFEEGYYYIEEDLYVDEAEEIFNFCSWIDENIGGAGKANIDMLWKGFKYPENKEYSTECSKIAEQIKRIRSLTA